MSTVDVILREFVPSDQEEVAAFYRSAKDNYMHLQPVAGPCYAWFIEDKLKPDGDMSNINTAFMTDKSKSNFWVATYEGIIVGCVGACITTKFTADHTELIRMLVSPDCRKKAVGAKLIAEFEKWAKEVGFKHIYLCTPSLLPEPNYLYPKCGFVLAESEALDISDRIDVPAGTTIVINHYVKELV